MAQKFLTYEEQIRKLETEKGLEIPDRAYAEEMLKQLGYFSLISGYKLPFKNSTTKKYRDDVCFEDIVALYKLDENLRELFLKYILQLERHIRSLISYYFCEKFGEDQSCYLSAANFTNSYKHKNDVVRLIGVLQKLAVESSDYAYINYQRKVYGNVPLWVLVNGITFGTLSKFYSLMTQDLKAKVSKNFESVNEKQLEQYLTVITKFRNVCAHNERLFSYKTRNDIPDTVLHKKLQIPQKGTQYNFGKRDLFSIVIAFRYLLPNNEFKAFKKKLNAVLNQYFSESEIISKEEIYNLMGFPENWQKITSYSIRPL